MKSLTFLIVLAAWTVGPVDAQSLYQGPASGSVASGVMVTTGGAENITGKEHLLPQRIPRNKKSTEFILEENLIAPTGAEGSNYFEDVDRHVRSLADTMPLVARSFAGIPQTNSIPPDPVCAVGPTHFIACVNSTFRIYDKWGNIVTTISADSWFASALPNPGPFDPKVSYDHYAKRWIMVWLQQDDASQTGHYLVSVSDDSIPTGTWYNWALPSTVNGSTPDGTWSDYQGVGFDSLALYITGRQFTFAGGSLLYGKIRAIGKSQLYANTAGTLGWKDLWDIRNPASLGSRPDAIRPAVMQTHSSDYYLMANPSSSGTNTYLILYKLTDPLGTPALTGVAVPVVTYTNPPGAFANQLGGSTILIESGGGRIRNEPTYRNGYIWATHAVLNPSNPSYQALNYVKIDVGSNTTVEDYTFGLEGHWFFYPAMTVDKFGNVLITYTRSGLDEYPGAFFNSRLSIDPPGQFYGSQTIQAGKANYVKDFGSGRNRWGDYNGAWLDPMDESTFWIFTEYAETPINTWGTWAAAVRLQPFEGPRVYASKGTVTFPNPADAWDSWEVGTVSDSVSLDLYNVGVDTLFISDIQLSSDVFHFNESVSFPLALAEMETLTVSLRFTPSAPGTITDTIMVISNDVDEPVKPILLSASAFEINETVSGVLYGGTGSGSAGAVLTIDPNNGAGSIIGSSGFTEVRGMTVHPTTKELYASSANGSASVVSRVNVSNGDAHQWRTFNVSSIRAIAFDRVSNELYGARTNGILMKMNLNTGDTTFVGSTGISNLYSLCFNPLTNALWGLQWSSSNSKLFRIDRTTGASAEVGTLGVAQAQAMAFDEEGKLFALYGSPSVTTQLARLDTVTGTATTIGSLGLMHGLSMAVDGSVILAIDDRQSGTIPNSYDLMQNHPNPFNPTTSIRYAIPKTSRVSLKIYNLLGQEVRTLVSGYRGPGHWTASWDGTNHSGELVSSGVYLYRLEAGTFSKTRKLLLLK